MVCGLGWSRIAWVAMLAGIVVACGGGGGGSDSTDPGLELATPTPQPTTTPVAEYRTPYPYVDVLHSLLTFDATRRVLYAYVPKEDASHPRCFAVIDVDDRSVQYTAPVDYVPFAMAVSADGSYLYVGTADTHEVVRHSLPSFAIDQRIPLGADEDGKSYDAGGIATSPSDPGVVSVSLIHNDYYTCALGIRVYEDGALASEYFPPYARSVGNILTFDGPPGEITTVCSGTYPDIVTRLSYDGSTIGFIDTYRGESGIAVTIQVSDVSMFTGGGSKWDLPDFHLRGALPPLTLYQQGDPAPLLYACIFADDSGLTAACLSQEDWGGPAAPPTPRAFVLYELIDANAFLTIPLDMGMTRGSRIFRTGPGEFAVSVSNEAPWLGQLDYRYQQTRIYFLSGIDTTYP